MKIVKSIFFYPLMLIRGLFLKIIHFLAGLCVLVMIASFFHDRAPDYLWLVYLAIGAGLEALAFYYDVILLKLNPTGTDLTLFQ